MRKPATVLLIGLTLTGLALLAAGPPAGNPAYAQEGGFEVAGKRLPTVEVRADDDPEDVQHMLGDLQSVDPGRYQVDLPPSSDAGLLASVRKEPGTSLWVTLMTQIPNDEAYSDEISMTVVTASGTECASTEVSLSNEDASYPGPVPIGLLVDPGTVESSSDRPECMAADTLYVQLAHNPAEDVELPVGLSVIEEPSVVGVEQLPEEADTEDFEPSWNGGQQADQVDGTQSFEDAPALRPGRYADSVSTGGIRLYRVDAGWGEHVQATLNLSPLSTGEAAQLEDEGLDVSVAIFGPSRQAVAGGEETVSAESEVVLGARSPTVRYRNRESSDSATGASALGGPYYVLVSAPTSSEMPDLSVSYELDLRVQGLTAGAPRYTGPAAPPKGSLVTDHEAKNSKSQSDGSAGSTAEEQRAAGSTDWWPVLGPVSVGLVAAAVALAVGLLVRRRASRG